MYAQTKKLNVSEYSLELFMFVTLFSDFCRAHTSHRLEV